LSANCANEKACHSRAGGNLLPKEFVREWTRISAKKTGGGRKAYKAKPLLFAFCSLRFYAVLPTLIWHDFRKIWGLEEKSRKMARLAAVKTGNFGGNF
jgi:hypothetical protein